MSFADLAMAKTHQSTRLTVAFIIPMTIWTSSRIQISRPTWMTKIRKCQEKWLIYGLRLLRLESRKLLLMAKMVLSGLHSLVRELNIFILRIFVSFGKSYIFRWYGTLFAHWQEIFRGRSLHRRICSCYTKSYSWWSLILL